MHRYQTIAVTLVMMVVTGCSDYTHEFTVSTNLEQTHRLVDAQVEQGPIRVFDAQGEVGEVSNITLGEHATDLQIQTDRPDYAPDIWISVEASLQSDGTILLVPLN